MSQEPVQTYPCPQCRKLIRYSTENKYRPFCSERCKLIDLGDWASERFRVPSEESAPSDEDGRDV